MTAASDHGRFAWLCRVLAYVVAVIAATYLMGAVSLAGYSLRGGLRELLDAMWAILVLLLITSLLGCLSAVLMGYRLKR